MFQKIKPHLITILVILVALAIYDKLTKKVEIDPVTGKPKPGGLAYKTTFALGKKG